MGVPQFPTESEPGDVMSVDLSDLVEFVRVEVSPPGSDLFTSATDDHWLMALRNAFWSVRMEGMLAGYTEADGLVDPINVGDEDLTRDLQQLIVLYAAVQAVMNQLRDLKTSFRAKAGPVEFETQQSAQVLREILLDLRGRRNWMLGRLSDLGVIPTYYIDAVAARQDSIMYGDTDWVSF